MDMCRLFQMKDTPENQPFLYQPYDYVLANGGVIHESRYNEVYKGPMLKDTSVVSVRESIKQKPRRLFSEKAPGVGDVIVLEHFGITECFYLDPHSMVLVDSFFTVNSDVYQPLTPQTSNYTPRGHTGLWQVADVTIIDNNTYFLLESMKYGRKADRLIADTDGNILIEHQKTDFDAPTLTKLQRLLHPETKPINVSRQSHEKPPMNQQQKYFENGTYERSGSPEVTEEQNYNMIDGRKNNIKRPEDRVSVRKRLREKQALVHGLPLPSSERIRQQSKSNDV